MICGFGLRLTVFSSATAQYLDHPYVSLLAGPRLAIGYAVGVTAMKILRAIVLLTMVAGFAMQVAPQSGDESKILAFENAWNRALELHDGQALAGLFDDTLVNVHDNGRQENKAQYLARVKGVSHNENVEQAVNESQAVRTYGNCAVVTGVYRQTGVQNGKAYVRRVRFNDTWVHKDGKWVVVASQTIPILH